MLKNIFILCLSSALLFACEAEEETTDTETAGTEMAGTEMAGTEMAGTEMAGSEMAGTETGETWTEPSDLVRDFNAVEISIVTERDAYCVNCATTEVCGDEFVADDVISQDDAGCIFIESTSEELVALQSFISCLQDSADEANACIAAINMCDDNQFEDCLDQYGGDECEMLMSADYLNRIEVACFGGTEDFICDDGTAIPGDYVCDAEADCEDGSDEANCSEE